MRKENLKKAVATSLTNTMNKGGASFVRSALSIAALTWIMTIALVSAAAVAQAEGTETCQDDYASDTKQVNTEFKEDISRCHYPGNADCWETAKEKKAEGIKAANKKRKECFQALTPKLDPNDPRLGKPTAPNTWSQQGPDSVWTDSKGRRWTFKPTSTDYEGREFSLDKNSVRVWQHATKGEIVSATYRYRNPLIAPDHEEHITVDGKRVPGY